MKTCKNGHQLSKENTYWYLYPTGKLRWFCRVCTRKRKRSSYDREANRAKTVRRRESGYTKLRQAEKRKKYPEKVRARAIAKEAKKKGLLIVNPCEVCGLEKVEMHHEDYSKPIEVRWLCQKHHAALHRKPS